MFCRRPTSEVTALDQWLPTGEEFLAREEFHEFREEFPLYI